MADVLITAIEGDGVRAHAPALTALLRDGFAAGAALGFLASVTDVELRMYWDLVADEVDARNRTLIVARAGDAMRGMVQVVADSAANGRHRAEVQKLVMAEAMRGQGIGRQLLAAAEDMARPRGIDLLYLSTHTHLPAVELYRRSGWNELGRIPGWAIVAGGQAVENVFFWKSLS